MASFIENLTSHLVSYVGAGHAEQRINVAVTSVLHNQKLDTRGTTCLTYWEDPSNRTPGIGSDASRQAVLFASVVATEAS